MVNKQQQPPSASHSPLMANSSKLNTSNQMQPNMQMSNFYPAP